MQSEENLSLPVQGIVWLITLPKKVMPLISVDVYIYILLALMIGVTLLLVKNWDSFDKDLAPLWGGLLIAIIIVWPIALAIAWYLFLVGIVPYTTAKIYIYRKKYKESLKKKMHEALS